MMRELIASDALPRWIALAALGFAACTFPELPPVDVDGSPTDGAGSDAAVDAQVDAPAACQPNTIDCDDVTDIYTECSSEGIATRQLQCPLGCATNMEKCLDIDPSNGLAMYLDMAATAPDLVLTGTSSINTWDGTILVGAIGVQIPNFVTNDGIRVFVVRSLSLDGTVNVVRRYSTPPLAFVSHGDVMIAGLLDISAQRSEGGAGGFWGGDQSSKSMCGGGWPGQNGPGAGGGGGADPGAPGGQTQSVNGAPGGTTMTSTEPLRGGCEGGTILTGDNSFGGGGGGGLQITSRTRITLNGGGIIDASGGGADHVQQAGGIRIAGGGGGGGGNVILEAPQVILDGASVVISTKGGAGAGASGAATSSGADGGYDGAAATGGSSPIQSTGGNGGTSTNTPLPGQYGGCGTCQGGGGGGAVGLTVLRNIVGAIAPQNGAVIRSKSMVSTIRTRFVP